MHDYERDELDDLPLDAPHRGAYRGVPADKPAGYRGLVVVIAAGILALVLGAVMFLIAPRGDSVSVSFAAAAAEPASPSGQTPVALARQ